MSLNILCSGFLVRYPLGGFSWHHSQYLIGLCRLGHKVTYFEHYGWADSCYNPALNAVSSDPGYGLGFIKQLTERYGLNFHWSYISEDGTTYGMSREQLAQTCRDADVYFNLSNINWIPELEDCRRRVLVDTDPVFTQIGAHGSGGPFANYQRLFTYGENVHQPGCEMPTGGARWLPTRQPVVLDLWPVRPGNVSAPLTTVMHWSPFGTRPQLSHYGQKDREFEPYFGLPRSTGQTMQLACGPPTTARERLLEGGWQLVHPLEVTRDPWVYQEYILSSRAEFSVAKHGYVSTQCGWFSERSAAYLASGRPVLVQDTGFSAWLKTGAGVIPFRNIDHVMSGIEEINTRYDFHCRAAKAVAEEYFDARQVLADLLERSLESVAESTR